MLNNTALSVAIGLIFIFLLYSLLAMIVMEFITRWFGIRQRFLVRCIKRMLEDQDRQTTVAANFSQDRLDSFKFFFGGQFEGKHSFARAFYAHPLIKYMAASRVNSKPSYIAPEAFSQTVIALLRGETFTNAANPMLRIKDVLFGMSNPGFDIEPQTLRYLRQLWIEAAEDINRFKGSLELWYNQMMERAEGWYKRLTQTILLVIGMTFAVSFNIDTIAIARILTKDKDLREQMVKIAEARYKAYSTVAATVSSVNAAAAPADTVLANMYRQLNADADKTQAILGLGRKGCKLPQDYNMFVVIIGWLITALALCLGAPFWFDLLNKIMMLRTSNRIPADTKVGSNLAGNAASIPAKDRVG